MPFLRRLAQHRNLRGTAYWPLGGLPWLLILGGYFYLRYWGTGDAALKAAKFNEPTVMPAR